MKYTIVIMSLVLGFILNSCQAQKNNKLMENDQSKNSPISDSNLLKISNNEWRKKLPADVYYIAREKGTERPYSSPLEDFYDTGTYECAVCGNPLFKSNAKFNSGCGWPSFFEPISKSSLIYKPDNKYGMHRTEVECGRCNSHLGHVFDDGPPPTGLRYCINGVVLKFDKKK
ncbi:MAG: peptide-methionine (R)-S-oxide reductase MsrB [Alphaproteobacteria bacterium]|nr:peptide-methionine (R)-S-oxide reductase MsrB [Alphaproteobacteria bacterium]